MIFDWIFFYWFVTAAWFVFSALGVMLAYGPNERGQRKVFARGLLLTPIWPLAVAVAAVALVAYLIAAVWLIAFPTKENR